MGAQHGTAFVEHTYFQQLVQLSHWISFFLRLCLTNTQCNALSLNYTQNKHSYEKWSQNSRARADVSTFTFVSKCRHGRVEDRVISLSPWVKTNLDICIRHFLLLWSGKSLVDVSSTPFGWIKNFTLRMCNYVYFLKKLLLENISVVVLF